MLQPGSAFASSGLLIMSDSKETCQLLFLDDHATLTLWVVLRKQPLRGFQRTASSGSGHARRLPATRRRRCKDLPGPPSTGGRAVAPSLVRHMKVQMETLTVGLGAASVIAGIRWPIKRA